MEICSIILHIVVYAKIYRYKRQGPDVKPINIFQNKSINISQTKTSSKNAESQSLLGLGINIVLIGILTLTSFINVKISKLVKTYNHLRLLLRLEKTQVLKANDHLIEFLIFRRLIKKFDQVIRSSEIRSSDPLS
jgi:hypothetical protein